MLDVQRAVEYPTQDEVNWFVNNDPEKLKLANMFTQLIYEWTETIPAHIFMTRDPWEKRIRQFLSSRAYLSLRLLESVGCNFYMDEANQLIQIELICGDRSLLYTIFA